MEDFTENFSGKLPNCFYLIYQGRQVKIFYNIGTSVKEIEKAAEDYLKSINIRKN